MAGDFNVRPHQRYANTSIQTKDESHQTSSEAGTSVNRRCLLCIAGLLWHHRPGGAFHQKNWWFNRIQDHLTRSNQKPHFSSTFNRIIPQQLIQKLDHLGLNTTLCNWLQDFLKETPQAVWVDNITSSTIKLSTGPHKNACSAPCSLPYWPMTAHQSTALTQLWWVSSPTDWPSVAVTNNLSLKCGEDQVDYCWSLEITHPTPSSDH